jgi:hypothetical protein
MADTGAPWNIPYVEPADLVRDYPTADEAQALAIAAGLTAAGVIKQVVQTVKTDVFSMSSDTFADVTGLDVTITPATNTNKVLLLVAVSASSTFGTTSGDWRLMRGSTAIGIGDAAGSRTRTTVAFNDSFEVSPSLAAIFLDTPNSAAATTYKVQIRRNRTSGSAFVNRSSPDTDASLISRSISSITAIEVAA